MCPAYGSWLVEQPRERCDMHFGKLWTPQNIGRVRHAQASVFAKKGHRGTLIDLILQQVVEYAARACRP